MKKSILFLTIGVLLTSCSFWEKGPLSEKGKDDAVVQKQEKQWIEAKEGDTVAVDYIGKFEDGSIFDSSIESEAKKSQGYSAGRKYEPLVVNLKEGGGTISGFWKGIVGMKVGEKKTVVLPPEEAYGGEWIDNGESTVSKSIFDKTLIRTIPLSETLDVVKMKVPRATLEQAGELPKVGDVLTNERGISAKVDAIDNENVSLSVDNKGNPFSGKKMVTGTKITFEDGNIGTITKVTKDEVTLSVENKSNPFSGKTLEVGLEGVYRDSQKIKITKMEGDTVTLSIKTKNSHALAGKTLVFDLELKEVK